MCKEKEYKVGTYISTNAIIYSEEFGEGCFIAPGVVIGPDCRMGICNYIESSAVLSHDNVLGDFNFISTNTVFGGNSRVENNCFFGLHSTIKDGIKIASDNLFGSCANIIKSIGYVGEYL